MTGRIILKTLPYLFLRFVAYLLLCLGMLLFLGIVGGIGYLLTKVFKEAAIPLIILVVISIIILWGIVRLVQRYVLYLIKAGHVAVITDLVRKGNLPAGVNQIAYGKDKVIKHFGETSILFAVDQLVRASVRQILNWLTSLAGCLSQIPGMGLIISFLRRVLSIAANYIDEAVLSYIIAHEEAKNVWKTAADGVVLYAQSWKSLLKTAVTFAFLVLIVWTAIFIFFLIAFLTLSMGLAKTFATAQVPASALQLLFGFVAVLAAYIIANVVKWILVDPLATVSMIVSYNQAIQGQEPSYDLHRQLSQVSRKFRELTQRAEEEKGVPAEG